MKNQQLIGAAIGAAIGFFLIGSDKKPSDSEKTEKTDLTDGKKRANNEKEQNAD